MQRLLLECLHQDPDLTGIAPRLLPQILAQRQGFALLDGRADLFGCLETLLQRGDWDKPSLKPLLAWVGRQPLPEQDFPYLQAFCRPRHGIPAQVMGDPTVQDSLLECLTVCHGYSLQQLKEMGFEAPAVERLAARADRGLLTRLKGLFRH